MIKQIPCFLRHTPVVLFARRAHNFFRLLFNLGCNGGETSFKKRGGIGTLWALATTRFNETKQITQKSNPSRLQGETAARARMTRRTFRLRQNQKGVAVTVGHHFFYGKKMTGLLTFLPQTPFGATPKNHAS